MLPKLNDTPKYEFMVPSTGKNVRFRPYLVKEEKVLLTAFANKDKSHGLKAIADTVVACSGGTLTHTDLTLYDLQYLFSKIRAKSVGEIVPLNIPCSECKTKNPVKVDIDNIQLEDMGQRNKKIELTDTISIELNYPSYISVLDNEVLMKADASDAEILIETVCESIVAVLTEEERIDMKEESRSAIREFVESMDTNQFKAVKEFVQGGPKLTFSISFDCISCKHHNDYKIENINDFF
jgi:hypothetical protein